MNQKIFNKLVEVAKKGDCTDGVICYEDLVIQCNLILDLSKIEHRNQLSSMLSEVNEYCKMHNPKLPYLGALVVLKGTKLCSSGFFTLMDEWNERLWNESDEKMNWRLMNNCWYFDWEAVK